MRVTFILSSALAAATAVQAINVRAIDIKQKPLNLKEHRSVLLEKDDSDLLVLVPLPPPPRGPPSYRLFRRDMSNHDHEHTGEMDAFGCHPQDSFLYGNSVDGKQHVMANLTIEMADGRRLVSMERFEPYTTRVECGRKMMLQFESERALNMAIKAWDWVNDKEDDNFVMIANHEGCGPKQERVPYNIHDVEYDRVNHIAHLSARRISWEELNGKMIIEYGQVSPSPDPPITTSLALHDTTLHRRKVKSPKEIREAMKKGFKKAGEGIKKVAKTVAKGVKDLAEKTKFALDKTISFGLDKSLGPAAEVLSVNEKGWNAAVHCIQCGTKGKFEVQGRAVLQIIPPNIHEMFLEARPRNFEAKMALRIIAKGENKEFNKHKEMLAVPLPGGIVVKGIFKLGATLDFDLGVNGKLNGHLNTTFGIVAKLHPDAKLRLDLKDIKKTGASNWEPQITDHPDTHFNAENDGHLGMFVQPGVSFGIDVLSGKWGYEASLKMKLPELDTKWIRKKEPAGNVCANPLAISGTEVSRNMKIEMYFRVGATKPGSPDLFRKDLFKVNKPLGAPKCYANEFKPPTPTTTAPPVPVVTPPPAPPPPVIDEPEEIEEGPVDDEDEPVQDDEDEPVQDDEVTDDMNDLDDDDQDLENDDLGNNDDAENDAGNDNDGMDDAANDGMGDANDLNDGESDIDGAATGGDMDDSGSDDFDNDSGGTGADGGGDDASGSDFDNRGDGDTPPGRDNDSGPAGGDDADGASENDEATDGSGGNSDGDTGSEQNSLDSDNDGPGSDDARGGDPDDDGKEVPDASSIEDELDENDPDNDGQEGKQPNDRSDEGDDAGDSEEKTGMSSKSDDEEDDSLDGEGADTLARSEDGLEDTSTRGDKSGGGVDNDHLDDGYDADEARESESESPRAGSKKAPRGDDDSEASMSSGNDGEGEETSNSTGDGADGLDPDDSLKKKEDKLAEAKEKRKMEKLEVEEKKEVLKKEKLELENEKLELKKKKLEKKRLELKKKKLEQDEQDSKLLREEVAKKKGNSKKEGEDPDEALEGGKESGDGYEADNEDEDEVAPPKRDKTGRSPIPSRASTGKAKDEEEEMDDDDGPTITGALRPQILRRSAKSEKDDENGLGNDSDNLHGFRFHRRDLSEVDNKVDAEPSPGTSIPTGRLHRRNLDMTGELDSDSDTDELSQKSKLHRRSPVSGDKEEAEEVEKATSKAQKDIEDAHKKLEEVKEKEKREAKKRAEKEREKAEKEARKKAKKEAKNEKERKQKEGIRSKGHRVVNGTVKAKNNTVAAFGKMNRKIRTDLKTAKNGTAKATKSFGESVKGGWNKLLGKLHIKSAPTTSAKLPTTKTTSSASGKPPMTSTATPTKPTTSSPTPSPGATPTKTVSASTTPPPPAPQSVPMPTKVSPTSSPLPVNTALSSMAKSSTSSGFVTSVTTPSPAAGVAPPKTTSLPPNGGPTTASSNSVSSMKSLSSTSPAASTTTSAPKPNGAVSTTSIASASTSTRSSKSGPSTSGSSTSTASPPATTGKPPSTSSTGSESLITTPTSSSSTAMASSSTAPTATSSPTQPTVGTTPPLKPA